jgi:LETM1 and EF-hand domain-containing protein 1
MTNRALLPVSVQKKFLCVKSEVMVLQYCYIQSTYTKWDNDPLKPSSMVEESVLALKNDLKIKEETKTADTQQQSLTAVVRNPSIGKRIVNEVKHYYHGFRLLFIDIKISWKFLWRLVKGDSLTRREKKQLVRTSADVFRLVPFSVFVIVPFMEFTLPIFLKLFPNMLPSTFQTANEQEAKMKKSLKVKLEMAKFLQKTLDEMALKRTVGSRRQSYTAKEFAEFCIKIRSSGQQASNEEILRFSKLFEVEITLDSLSRPQLLALCRVLEISTLGPNSILRFLLRMRLRSLAADDKVIQKEGIDSLTVNELQAACRVRGMRALGVSEIRLKSQLLQWLDLSLNEKVPPSLMLLSRALYLPDSDTTADQLKVAIASLPESVVAQTCDAISQRRGKIDNEVRILAVKLQEAMIEEERKENVIKPFPVTALLSPTSASELLAGLAPVIQGDFGNLHTFTNFIFSYFISFSFQ